MSASIYAVTLAAGWIYLQALCAIAEKKGANFTATDISNSVNSILKNSTVIKEFINSAKEIYKKQLIVSPINMEYDKLAIIILGERK